MTTITKKLAGLAGLALLAPALTGVGPASALVAAEKGAGQAVSGAVTFDCLLEPFQSAFRYEGPITLTAAGEALKGTLPDIPGIAPVEIDNGSMTVKVAGEADGEAFVLEGTRTVDAAASEPVPVPELSGTVAGLQDDAEIALTTFSFSFKEMMGLKISAECNASKGKELGSLSASSDTPSAGGNVAADDLAEDGAGDSGWVRIALWATPAVLLVAAAVFLLRGRGRRA